MAVQLPCPTAARSGPLAGSPGTLIDFIPRDALARLV